MENQNSFTIYNASAGSGKTFTLVKEYLLLLFTSEKKDNYKNILAITFTNKAVAEMKSRIIDNLFAFSCNSCPEKHLSMLQGISEELELNPQEIQLKSQTILKNILHNYAAFEVSTIDGFTHRLLRTFAKDLELPLNFEVVLDTEEVLQEAVDRLISKAGEDKKLTKVLINFVLSKTDEDKSWDISRDLFEIAKLLTNENNRGYLKLVKNKTLEDFERLSAKIKAEKEHLSTQIDRLCDVFFELLGDEIEKMDFTRGSCFNFFVELKNGILKDDFSKQWQLNIAGNPLYSSKVLPERKKLLDELQPQIVQCFHLAKDHIQKIKFLEAIQKDLVPFSLLSAIQNELEEIKKEQNIILISEFNAIIGETVKDQPAPFIYERLGERYRHYFIDEFQDTSQLQWENLIPLVEHNLNSVPSGGLFGSLNLVGDAKQSIYRWRGGKAEQFMDLCAGINPFQVKEKLTPLPNNYRSAKEIVDFNNSFFKFSSDVLTHPEHQKLFSETSRQEVKITSGGYVNVSFIEAENAAAELEIYPEKVLEIIQKLESENIPKRDICILSRRKKEGYAIADFLSENNIPIISAESLLIERSPKIKFITAVLKLAVNGKDQEQKNIILEFLSEKYAVENEFDFSLNRIKLDHQDFFDSLKEIDIHFNLKKSGEISVYEGVEYIIRSFGLVEGSDAYVQFFLDFVFEYTQKKNAGITGFLEKWEQKKDSLSIVAPEGEDAVQIMTIHKAKGLEFPVVIYPFANNKIQDVSREKIWISLPDSLKEDIPVAQLRAVAKMTDWNTETADLYNELCCNSELDALNVLYVAFTRAAQQLYVISKADFDKAGNEKPGLISGLLISYLKHLGKWDGSFSYEWGSSKEYIIKDKKRSFSLPQKKMYSSPISANGISFVTKNGVLWNSKQEKAIEKGELIHQLFEEIETSEDVGPVLKNALENGLFDPEEEHKIRKSIQKVVEHPELSEFYSGSYEILNERELITENGLILRPDRINIKDGKVSIIDYKTGEKKTSHRRQLEEYSEELGKMNFKIEKKILVYLNEIIEIETV